MFLSSDGIDESALRAGARDGDPSAMKGLADLLLSRGDDEGARQWYRSASEGGNAAAMNNLGLLDLRAGAVVSAVLWFGQAAHAGEASARTNLGVAFHRMGDIVSAEGWYRAAASLGDQRAMANLGLVLRSSGRQDEFETSASGTGPPWVTDGPTSTKARERAAEGECWLRAAAEGGHVLAMVHLGRLLMRLGLFDEAEAWYRQAALLGSVPAMISLAVRLELTGQPQEAERFLRLAAGLGNRDAMDRLGQLLTRPGAYTGTGGRPKGLYERALARRRRWASRRKR